MNKFQIILLAGLVSLMVIVAGCRLTPGKSLAGNARATGSEKAKLKAPQTNERAVSSPQREVASGCYYDGDCASNQYCQGAKTSANPAYSMKGSCVAAPCTPGPTGNAKCVTYGVYSTDNGAPSTNWGSVTFSVPLVQDKYCTVTISDDAGYKSLVKNVKDLKTVGNNIYCGANQTGFQAEFCIDGKCTK